MTTTVPAGQGVEYDKELRSRLVDWLGTPSELRGDALTLPQFAEREGCHKSLDPLANYTRSTKATPHPKAKAR